MSIKINVVGILALLFASMPSCYGDDSVLLAYGDLTPNRAKIEILEMDRHRVLSSPKVIGSDTTNFNLNGIIASAKKILAKATSTRFTHKNNWLYFGDKIDKAGDPFGEDPAPLLSALEWSLYEATMREVDLGRTRDSNSAWRGEPSGRVWWEIKMRGLNKDGSSVGIVTVFLFQDMSEIRPKQVETTELEKAVLPRK